MTIQRMHHEVKLRGNKINSNHYKDLPTAFIDDFLNDAHLEFKEICYSGRNDKRYKIGFEVTQQRIDLLSPIVIPDEIVTPTVLVTNVYKIDLTNLDQTYDHFLRGTVSTDCGVIPITIEKHNDLDTILRDENRKPSAKWKRCIGVFASPGDNSLLIYTGGEFTIDEASITYLRRPTKVFYGGYDSLEFLWGDTTAPKTADPSINSDFSGTAASIIVDLAVQLIYARSLENPNTLQLVEDKITRIL